MTAAVMVKVPTLQLTPVTVGGRHAHAPATGPAPSAAPEEQQIPEHQRADDEDVSH